MELTKLSVGEFNHPQLPTRKNLMGNGNFDVWQRSTLNQTTNGFYNADRWGMWAEQSTFTSSQQAFTLGQTDVPNNPKYYMRHVVTSASTAGAYVTKFTKIENVIMFSGKTVTLSFWAKADANKQIAIEFVPDYGTGGSPSPRETAVYVHKFDITTTWQKYTKTFEISSLSGRILGTDNKDHMAVYIWFEAGSSHNNRTDSLGNQSGTFDLAQFQLEKGANATDFEQVSYTQQVDECMRYFQKHPIYATWGMSRAVNTTQVEGIPIRMSRPTIGGMTLSFKHPTTMASSTTGWVRRHNSTTSSAAGTIRAWEENDNTAVIYLNGVTGLSTNQLYIIYTLTNSDLHVETGF